MVGIQGTLELILNRLGTLERAPAGQNNGGGLLPIPAQDNRNRQQQAPLLLQNGNYPHLRVRNPRYGFENVRNTLFNIES